MSNYRRAKTPGGTYFFTVNTLRRQRFLTDADVRAALREGIELARRMKPFRIEGWVLLPDHLHCIWTLPPEDADFASRWSIIKRTVTQRCAPRLNRPDLLTERRRRRHQSSLWQHRFWEHQIRDEGDFRHHANYLHWNPVKHGYVSRVAEWPYSTFHRFVRAGFYPPDWGGHPALESATGFGK